MKWLSRIITLVLFIFFFVLALKNTQETALYFFWGYELRGPLVLIVLCFFVAGAFLGLMTMIPVVFRRQRELAKQRKRIAELEQAQETHVKTNETSSASTVSVSKTE
ncbi:LapA family protein [Oxalobacter aliiformigenes]|uniref:LapA family protein n=1 Tax=Oxalobacter aliiformigenes TaxID=2946593 RepID=UPI0022AFC850|nr:LapA family protein [Oxalobacter aliiformigenes]MCZ4064259.1 LapA family protein [Oxalobacter aliiformigenes]WAV98806.1 LapA family protein [Oxalobacter aliiformigenes]